MPAEPSDQVAPFVGAKAPDPLFSSRMGGEEIGEADLAVGQGVDDVAARLGRLYMRRDSDRVAVELLQGPGQRVTVAVFTPFFMAPSLAET